MICRNKWRDSHAATIIRAGNGNKFAVDDLKMAAGKDIDDENHWQVKKVNAAKAKVLELYKADIGEKKASKIQQCGIFLSNNRKLFSAPDAMIGKDTLLEIKVYFIGNPKSLDDIPPRFACFDANREIRKDSKKYAQIQLALRICSRRKAIVILVAGDEWKAVEVGRDLSFESKYEDIVAYTDILDIF